jgi:membrane-associated phospholipid phosphatase
MKRTKLVLLLGISLGISAVGQGQTDTVETLSVQTANRAFDPVSEVYNINPKVDIPVTLAATGFTIFGFSQVYSKDNTPEATIRNLNVQNIPRFDRWGADVYSEKAANTSDYLFYGSVPVPFLLLADKEIRKDAAKIGLLYLQAMSATGTLYTGSGMTFDRFRPYAYNANASMGDRTEGNARNSFFAGHAALVGTATFFTAKVFADYHPDSKLKWVFFGAAAVATGTTGYLRHRGGRHFPSDILVGTAVGTLSGILIPHFHKNKLFKDPALSVVPFTGRSHGLLLTYNL